MTKANLNCIDLNVKNTDWDEQGFVSRYFNGSSWIAGSLGVDIDEGFTKVTLTNVSAGTSMRTGAAETSWSIRLKH